jgi:hypothetical protein
MRLKRSLPRFAKLNLQSRRPKLANDRTPSTPALSLLTGRHFQFYLFQLEHHFPMLYKWNFMTLSRHCNLGLAFTLAVLLMRGVSVAASSIACDSVNGGLTLPAGFCAVVVANIFGAFIAFHGSWDRSPLEQQASNIAFQPFAQGNPSGKSEVCASGFAGKKTLMKSGEALARADGVTRAVDGSLYITQSHKGKVWRVFCRGK